MIASASWPALAGFGARDGRVIVEMIAAVFESHRLDGRKENTPPG